MNEAVHRSSPGGFATKRVATACQRCRRIKHKCDTQRPCMLCKRAGVPCIDPEPTVWKPYDGQSKKRRLRSSRTTSSPRQDQDDHSSEPALAEPTNTRSGATWNSSSTIDLVEEAFHYHDAATPPTLETSAFSAQQQTQTHQQQQQQQPRPFRPRGLRAKVAPPRISSSATKELHDLLPAHEPATLLLNTYFDRVHWFLLLFHQDDFRRRFSQLYDTIESDTSQLTEFADFVSTLLAAFAVTLQHAGVYRKNLLRGMGLDPDAFQERVLGVLKSRLLDILASGSLEAVQTCVLLGSHYLYHGRPELAWPICGCGLRVAQALNLHRRQGTGNSTSNLSETRKRVWWAVYEIETVCSMLYGYPLSISDSDCDTEFLDPLHRPLTEASPATSTPSTNTTSPTTLLSYKYHMSKLSMIIRAVLADIYGMYRGYNTTATSTPSSNRGRQLQNLLRKVSELDRRLNAWYDKVPPVLRLDADSGSSPVYGSLGEIDRDISASGPRFESYIFGLQRLSLNLAFENTRILLHRPLLSHEIGILPPRQSLTTTTDPFSQSIETCRAAAMRTAAVGSSPSFTYANTTFAAAFFDMHLFTAGVTLCILTSLEPLSVRSHEAKMGVRSLMAMQAALQESSILAAQGLDILKKLITLVLQKETEEMFDFGGGTPGLAASRSQTPHQKTKEQAVPNLQDSQSQRTIEGESLSQSQDQQDCSVPVHSDPILAALNNNFDFNMEASTATADFGDNNTPTSYVPNIEFHENPTVARTLMDLEQVIYGIPAEPSLDQVPPVDDTAMASITTSNPYAEQDQGWIWGFDYFQMLDDCMH